MHLTGPIRKMHLKRSTLLFRHAWTIKGECCSLQKEKMHWCFTKGGLYQWFSCRVQLVFGSSQQQTPRQDVESLSASCGTVVHLSFPQFVFIKRRTMKKPEKKRFFFSNPADFSTQGDYDSLRDWYFKENFSWRWIWTSCFWLTWAASTCPAGCSGWVYLWQPSERRPSADTPPWRSALWDSWCCELHPAPREPRLHAEEVLSVMAAEMSHEVCASLVSTNMIYCFIFLLWLVIC